MTCKYVSTNTTTGDYERVCERAGDGAHGFCNEHEALTEQQMIARGGNEAAVARFRSGLCAAESLWADDADLAADLKAASEILLPRASLAK